MNNTGNPIGSTDARDLYDNAQVFDNAINSTAATYTDRLGVVRKTLPKAIADAQVGGPVYDTTTAGLAGTTSGQYFSVPASDSTEYLILYKNTAGSAVEVKRYPSKAAYETLGLQLKKKADVVIGKNLFNPNDPDLDSGRFVNNVTGALDPNASYIATGYIPVTAGATYTSNSTNQLWAWYDLSKKFISGGTTATKTAPAGAAFLRESTAVGHSTFQVEAGSSATTYAAYSAKIPAAQLGTLGTGSIADKAVTPEKTSFITTGKNKFNKDTATVGIYVGDDGLIDSNASYAASDYIPVTPGVTYYTPYFRFTCYFDANKNLLAGGAGNVGTTFTPPAGAAYVRLTLPPALVNSYQVEVGTAPTSYEPYRNQLVGIDLGGDRVTPEEVTFLPIGKNKFNLRAADVSIGYYVNPANGALAANSNYNATGFIPVVGGATYTLSYKHMIAWYDSAKVFISGSDSTDTNPTQTAPANAVYLRATVAVSTWNAFQVERGTSQTAFEAYGYVLEDETGTPILVRAENVIDASATAPLAIAPKQYIPAGKELAIYHENVVKDYPSYRGRTGISFSGGKETEPSTKIVPTSGQAGTTISGSVSVVDKNFVGVAGRAFSIVVSDPNKTTATNLQHIGDSITGRMTWVNIINATAAAAGLTFSGNRTSNSATPAVKCEGQGGWTMTNYHTVDVGGKYLSPFMQPANSGYLYFGQTSFWIDANSASPTYNAAYFLGVRDGFSPTTGRKLAPNVGDVMGDNGGYIVWNGSSWASIASTTFGGFAFNYGKYRQAWGIPAPTIMHIMLGTNDFFGALESSFSSFYADYKAKYDTMIASIKADTPSAKIIVAIPVSSGRQGKWGTLTTERVKRAMFLLAGQLITDYGNREAEGIYLLDYHATMDRFYGFDQSYETPYSQYSGATGDGLYKADITHPSVDGFEQMGNAYMGLVQHLR